MIEIAREYAHIMKPLFSNTESAFALSFLQGYMGRGWVNDMQSPCIAQIIVGDFCLLAGDCQSEGATALVRNIPPEFASKELLMSPQNEGWAALIEQCHKNNRERTMRYATKVDNGFDIVKLQGFVDNLDAKYNLRSIDEEAYHETFKRKFSSDWCSQYSTAEEYAQSGLGFCIELSGEIICGASSYISYEKGISVQIDTCDGYKRQGLATACGARLILECLQCGIYPDWDACSLTSLALAEKLGYHLDSAYTTYLISS